MSQPENPDKPKPKSLFAVDKYSDARRALHGSLINDLPGREIELEQLQDFIQTHLDNKSSGSLYVSGPPGTGKTACLSTIMKRPEFKKAFKIVNINCTMMKSAPTIYAEIIDQLGLAKQKNCKNRKDAIEKYLQSSRKMLLFILDELDQLETKNQSILYSIFEWPGKIKSKLVLVGIANSLDLTDRILPRLQSRCELKPKLMHFASYTKPQIVKIISERLEAANVSDIFTPAAIQLLAGKVAAMSGDIRKALDISRKVVDVVRLQKEAQVLQPTNDNGKSIKYSYCEEFRISIEE